MLTVGAAVSDSALGRSSPVSGTTAGVTNISEVSNMKSTHFHLRGHFYSTSPLHKPFLTGNFHSAVKVVLYNQKY